MSDDAIKKIREAKRASQQGEGPPDDGFDEWDPTEPATDKEEKPPEENRIYSVRELLEASGARAQSRERGTRGTTGHYQLDDLTGGLRPGHNWVIAAETSWGKTSLIISIADENLHRGKRVLIVSFEDPAQIYGDRLLCRRAKIDAKHLRDRRLLPLERDAMAETIRKAEDVPVYIEAGNTPIERLVQQVRRVVKRETIDIVVWDYLQEVKTERRFQDERVRFRETAAVLRDVGRELGCCTMILSQITEMTGKKYPDKNSIRESRDVANAAEHILIGYTLEEAILDDHGKPVIPIGTKCIKVDKSKDGQKGTVAMAWNEMSACFEAKIAPYGSSSRLIGDELDDFADLDAPDDTETRYP